MPAMTLRQWNFAWEQKEEETSSLDYQRDNKVAGAYSTVPDSQTARCTSDKKACHAVAEAMMALECGDGDDSTSNCSYLWLLRYSINY
jgi:hypothetical protein